MGRLKPVRDFGYIAGRRRFIPDQCTGCSKLVNHFENDAGLYCRVHASVVEKPDHTLNVFSYYQLDQENPYKQKRERCDRIDAMPRHIEYQNTFAGMYWQRKHHEEKGEVVMLKEQRERLPQFLANVQTVIEKNGMNKVVELLGVTDRTVKEWLKGKENGGTEPTSDAYSRHEDVLNQYLANTTANEEAAHNKLETGGENQIDSEQLGLVRIADILPNPYQPRKIFDEEAISELAASMEQDGLIQPIVVRRTGEGIVLVAGERRLRASQKLGWEKIKAITTQMTEAQAAELPRL